MKDSNKILELFDEVKERIFTVKGVVGISIGLKEKGGDIIPEHVYRVYVNKKRPLEDLLPGEIIPEEIFGIRTDVLQHMEAACCGSWSSSHLTMGLEIAKRRLNAESEWGTLGCFVKKGSAPERYLLTNFHVFWAPGMDEDITVYQPAYKTCAGIECNSPVAMVQRQSGFGLNGHFTFNGKSFVVDCILAKLENKVTYKNTVTGIGDISGIEDISGNMFTPGTITVRKKGSVTGITEGVITEFQGPATKTDPVPHWRMLITPTALGGKPYDKTYVISDREKLSIPDILDAFSGPVKASMDPSNPRKIRFQGQLFSTKGDSGSPIILSISGQHKMVGVLHQGLGLYLEVVESDTAVWVPGGVGLACFIAPVFASMDLATTDFLPPSGGTSGDKILVPGDDVAALMHEEQKTVASSLALAEADFLKTEQGALLINEFIAHVHELIQLVHHHRAVKVVWYRNHCPSFSAILIKCINNHALPIAKMYRGVSFQQALSGMCDVLVKHGSPGLRAAVEKHKNLVLSIISCGETYDDILDFLRKEPVTSLHYESYR